VNGGESMTESLSESSSADLVWAGEGYSAFASATATNSYLKISFIDSNNNTQYEYSLTNSGVKSKSKSSTSHDPSAPLFVCMLIFLLFFAYKMFPKASNSRNYFYDYI
jgi:hypothetical protein